MESIPFVYIRATARLNMMNVRAITADALGAAEMAHLQTKDLNGEVPAAELVGYKIHVSIQTFA